MRKPIDQRFCEVVSEYHGEKIEKLQQIDEIRMSGHGLMRFAEFYFWSIYPETLISDARRKDDLIYRLKAIVGVLLFLIILLLFNI